MNIAIVRAFIALRQFALNYKELAEQILELKQSVGNHNEQLNQIYDALENLLDDKVDRTIHKKMWENRVRIGFKSTKK
jgi:ABC-type cobalamin transport system ATPase subunit